MIIIKIGAIYYISYVTNNSNFISRNPHSNNAQQSDQKRTNLGSDFMHAASPTKDRSNMSSMSNACNENNIDNVNCESANVINMLCPSDIFKQDVAHEKGVNE